MFVVVVSDLENRKGIRVSITTALLTNNYPNLVSHNGFLSLQVILEIEIETVLCIVSYILRCLKLALSSLSTK